MLIAVVTAAPPPKRNAMSAADAPANACKLETKPNSSNAWVVLSLRLQASCQRRRDDEPSGFHKQLTAKMGMPTHTAAIETVTKKQKAPY
jgi:hypothetical protein